MAELWLAYVASKCNPSVGQYYTCAVWVGGHFFQEFSLPVTPDTLRLDFWPSRCNSIFSALNCPCLKC